MNNEFGWTPLFYTTWHGHGAVVELLPATDEADANSKDKDSQTPLYSTKDAQETVTKLLLERGMEVVTEEKG